MAATLDRETIERLRAMPLREVLAHVANSLYGAGPVGSEDFQAIYEQLVEEGVLTWEQIEGLPRR